MRCLEAKSSFGFWQEEEGCDLDSRASKLVLFFQAQFRNEDAETSASQAPACVGNRSQTDSGEPRSRPRPCTQLLHGTVRTSDVGATTAESEAWARRHCFPECPWETLCPSRSCLCPCLWAGPLSSRAAAGRTLLTRLLGLTDTLREARAAHVPVWTSGERDPQGCRGLRHGSPRGLHLPALCGRLHRLLAPWHALVGCPPHRCGLGEF